MSWKAINELIGLATIDPDFCQELLVNPRTTLLKKGVDLTPQELEFLSTITAIDISEFGQKILDKLVLPQPR